MKKINKTLTALGIATYFGLTSKALAVDSTTFKGSLEPNSTATFTLSTFITNMLNLLIWMAGIIAFGFLVYGGILFVTAQGDSGKVEKARNTILYSVIGIIVVVGALMIMNWAKGLPGSNVNIAQ